MKKYIKLCLSAFILFLLGCSGSDAYQGNWKATDADGNHFEISFDLKSFSIKDSTDKVAKYGYTQHSYQMQNSIESYGIQLEDGRNYTIHFPIADEKSKGVILFENKQPAYTISRTAYIKYEDLYKLIQ